MDKKTKLMAICAAGAAAILIGAGLARCAIEPSEPEAVVPVEERSQKIEKADESLAGYAGTTWESEDGACTLTLSDSTIVESGEAGVQVMYYEVLSEESADAGVSAQISFTRSAGEAASQTLLSISDAGGRKSISCDAFSLSKNYLIAEGSDAGLELAAHPSELNDLLDAEDPEIASAIPDGDARHLGRRGLHRLQRGRPHNVLPPERRSIDDRSALPRPRERGAERAMRRVATMISDRRFRIAFASTLLFATLMLVPASPAYASIADDVNAWLAGLLRDACNWMFTNQVAVLSSIGYEGIIGADFSQMLTTAGDVSMYDIARGVWDAAVLPIGCGVLGLVFTVKLIQISQRMDGNASFPGVKEVVFLLVFFAVFLFLIQNSFELMEAIYSVVGLAIDRTMALFGAGGAMDLSAVSVVTEDDDVPALIALLLVSVISWVVVLGAYIVALVVCWARAIQLYVMAAFGPIPLSLMALDDTRQIGIGYLKNFTAVCLAGLIILILLVAFPLILGGLTGASTSTGTPIDGIATGLTYALQYLAMCVLLILSLVKSGAWARDIVSGV